MPPKVKFQKEEIIEAALNVVRRKGIDGLTAREVATELSASTRPIFTYYPSMDDLKRDVYEAAKRIHGDYIRAGLRAKIPFLGVGMQYLAFAREEQALYRLLYLTKPDGVTGGAEESLRMSQELVRASIMEIYRVDAHTADCYYRDLWLVVFSFATMIVTDECPFTDAQMQAILTEMSLAVCKAYKEIPGLPTGDYDRDAIFTELVKRPQP